MLFSVCIPVYNTSMYLDECIQSVLSQTEKDYEIILVNDGSTDNSGEICDRYAAEHSNIRVIHKENEGLMMTRRRAFREAGGEYFICLDSDDYWRSDNVLLKIREMIESQNCDMVLFNYIAGKEDPAQNQNIVLFDKQDKYVFNESNKKEVYNQFLFGKGLNAIWIKAVSRHVMDIDTDYSPWKPYICRAEDMFQSYPMLTNAVRIGYIREPLVHYRWTPGSISNNPKLKYYQAFRTIYSREDEYLPAWNLGEEVEKKAKLRRIPNILGILTTGYHISKKAGKLAEWKAFIGEVSKDPFFADLFPGKYMHEISGYYKWIGRLVRKNNTFLLSFTLEAYQWYVQHIKRKK